MIELNFTMSELLELMLQLQKRKRLDGHLQMLTW